MLALVRRGSEFAGIIGNETTTKVNDTNVCIGDIVRVAEDSNNNECEGVVGIFTDRVSVMGLGSIPLSELNVVEIIKSYKELEVGSTIHEGYYKVENFKF